MAYKVTPFVCSVKFQCFPLSNIFLMSVFISHFGWLHYNGHLRVREIWTNFPIILSHRLMKKQTKATVYMHRNVMNLEWYLQWEKKVQKITTFHAHEVMWEWQPLYALTRCNHKKNLTNTRKRASLYNQI